MGWTRISLTLLITAVLAGLHHVTGTFPFPRLCGDDLVSAVAMVCQDRGYYAQPNKRSANVFEPETRAKSFLKSVTFAADGREKRQVRTGRIVHECCTNTCSFSIVESYCNPWPDDVVHDEEVHVRQGKSAEEDNVDRHLDGPSQVENVPEALVNASVSRDRSRLEKIVEVLADRLQPKSTMTSAPSSPGRKSRKLSKSERRNSSRAAKAARREERRRNRQRSSLERSRKARRKNKDAESARRAKRNSLSLWTDMFSDRDVGSFNIIDPSDRRSSNKLSPSTLDQRTIPINILDTTEFDSSREPGAHQLKTDNSPLNRKNNEAIGMSSILNVLRTLVSTVSRNR